MPLSRAPQQQQSFEGLGTPSSGGGVFRCALNDDVQ